MPDEKTFSNEAVPCSATEQKQAEQKHHPFSPSTLQRLSLCPGSWRMTKDIPEPPQSDDAAEGTKLHEAVVTGNLDDLNAEQQAAVTACIEFAESLIYPAETKPLETISEYKVSIEDTDGILTEGIVDFAVIHPDKTADLVDWKFGRTPAPEANGNYQLAAYALGIMQQFNVSSVTAHIFQPRIFAHTSYTFTNAKAILHNIKHIINRAKQESILLCASDEACRYCRAASTCPACNQRYGLVPADVQYNMLTDPVKLLDLWERAQMATKLVDAIKTAVTDYIKEHGALGDWTFEQRAGKREISDTAKLYDRVSTMLNSHDLAECYSVKVNAVLDKLTERYQKTAEHEGRKLLKKDAKKQAEELISDLLVRAPGSAVLTKGVKKS